MGRTWRIWGRIRSQRAAAPPCRNRNAAEQPAVESSAQRVLAALLCVVNAGFALRYLEESAACSPSQ